MCSSIHESIQQKRAWVYYMANNYNNNTSDNAYENLIEFANNIGYKVVGNSTDFDTKSIIRSTGLVKIMQAAIQGSFDVLIIYSSMMLGRDTEQRNDVTAALQSRNIRIYSYKDSLWLT